MTWPSSAPGSVVRRRPEVFRQDQLGQRDSAELIRRREVSRVLRKMDLSPDEVEGIERLSCALVGRILLGPIAEAMARLEKRTYQGGPGGDHAF